MVDAEPTLRFTWSFPTIPRQQEWIGLVHNWLDSLQPPALDTSLPDAIVAPWKTVLPQFNNGERNDRR